MFFSCATTQKNVTRSIECFTEYIFIYGTIYFNRSQRTTTSCFAFAIIYKNYFALRDKLSLNKILSSLVTFCVRKSHFFGAFSGTVLFNHNIMRVKCVFKNGNSICSPNSAYLLNAPATNPLLYIFANFDSS